MAKTLEIENVPDATHEALVARAEQDGLSVSAYVLRELQKQVAAETKSDELLARIRRLPRVDLGDLTAADLIREGREERIDQVIDAVGRR
jgi:plasmid stability protein